MERAKVLRVFVRVRSFELVELQLWYTRYVEFHRAHERKGFCGLVRCRRGIFQLLYLCSTGRSTVVINWSRFLPDIVELTCFANAAAFALYHYYNCETVGKKYSISVFEFLFLCLLHNTRSPTTSRNSSTK
jgi:hypothetical protein